MRVVVLVPDRDVVLTRQGDEVEVTVDALDGRSFRGTLARTAQAEDNERLMRVEIDLPNPDGLLCDGMYGKASITLERDAKSLTVPAACVVDHHGRNGGVVFVVRDGQPGAPRSCWAATTVPRLRSLPESALMTLLFFPPASLWKTARASFLWSKPSGQGALRRSCPSTPHFPTASDPTDEWPDQRIPRNPIAVTVLVLAIAVLGGLSAYSIPIDILPVFKSPAVQALVFYSGMPATSIEKNITARLERGVVQASGGRRSSRGRSSASASSAITSGATSTAAEP